MPPVPSPSQTTTILSGKTFDLAEKENYNLTAVARGGLVKIAVPLQLRRRKIYAFLQVKAVALNAKYLLAAEVRLLRNGVPISQPLGIATSYLDTDATVKNSISSMFTGYASNGYTPGGFPAPDSILVYLSNPQSFGSTTPYVNYIYSVVLNPFYVDCEIDAIEMVVVDTQFVANMTGMRGYLCCVSQQ